MLFYKYTSYTFINFNNLSDIKWVIQLLWYILRNA